MLEKKFKRPHFTLRARQHTLLLGSETKIMGILNLTPDSFSSDGRMSSGRNNIQRNLRFAFKLIHDGAHIIDIGGESTRPGAAPVSVNEEMKRVIPTLKLLVKKISCPISIDTYKESVAKAALDTGASIINNIMGVKTAKSFLRMVQRYQAAIVIMHIRGKPQTMQKNIHYKNVVQEIIAELKETVEKCLEIGIKSDKIIIDPGIGFGKTVEQNLRILAGLEYFSVLKMPILIGTSRKSFIGKTLNCGVMQRLAGTLSTVALSICKGAHIVRVHDVKEVAQAAKMADAIILNL